MFFCKDQDQSVRLDACQERLRQSQQIHTDNTATLAGAISLLAEIRHAAGDPKGKLMQDELVRKIRIMRNSLEAIACLAKNPDETTVAQIKTIATDALNPLQ